MRNKKNLKGTTTGTLQPSKLIAGYEDRAVALRRTILSCRPKLARSRKHSRLVRDAVQSLDLICTLCRHSHRATAEDASRALSMVENLFETVLTLLSRILA